MKKEKISIICPECKKFLTKAENDNKIHKLQCRNCRKWIWFNPMLDEYKVKETPQRHCASGMRFY